MAVIDTFLKLLVTQKAERLLLAPEEVPILFKEEEPIQLSMPAVPADLVKRLFLEIIGPHQSTATAGDQDLEGTYRTDEGEEFLYQVRAKGTAYRIEMQVVVSDDSPPDPDRSPALGAANRGDPQIAPDLDLAVPPISSAPRTRAPFAEEGPAPQPDPELLYSLEDALRAEASDLFLSAGKPAQMRLNGIIKSLDTSIITDAQILQLLPREECRHELEASGSTDFGVRWTLSGGNRRFRINVFHHANGLAAALRPIRARIPILEELHLPGDLHELCSYPSGLVLVTGASGSGKSTTLAALVEHLNQSKARHIITIEDPIEFEHQPGRSLIHQREVGASVESFSSGLRAALRENPDVILLGEMRDLPTISAALTAAETGHLVLSTLHTGSATAAVNRIVDVFPGHQQAHVRVQLASSLRAVVAQLLVPAVGQKGRVPALERLIVTPAVANQIREGHEHHMRSAMQTGGEDGMITLERSLAALQCRGQITRETAYRYARDPQALQKLFD